MSEVHFDRWSVLVIKSCIVKSIFLGRSRVSDPWCMIVFKPEFSEVCLTFVFGSHKSLKKSLYLCKEVIKLSEFQEVLIDLILIGSYLKELAPCIR